MSKEEQVHKPEHWFTTYYRDGEEKKLDNADTMGIAVACTASFAKPLLEKLFAEESVVDLPGIEINDEKEWQEFIERVVSYFSSYCYMQRAGKKDDPLTEIGKAGNYNHRIVHGKWEGE